MSLKSKFTCSHLGNLFDQLELKPRQTTLMYSLKVLPQANVTVGRTLSSTGVVTVIYTGRGFALIPRVRSPAHPRASPPEFLDN